MRLVYFVRRGLRGGVLVVMMLAGCTYTVTPGIVPPVPGETPVSLSEITVLVSNAEKDDRESDILSETNENSGLRTNRHAWSGKLVEALARELARRGAAVRLHAPLTVMVSVPQITFEETRDVLQLKAKARVATPAGWTKEYAGAVSRSVSSVYSLPDETGRMSSEVLLQIVKSIIDDPEFADRLFADLGKR